MCSSVERTITCVYYPDSDSWDIWATIGSEPTQLEMVGGSLGAPDAIVNRFFSVWDKLMRGDKHR
jgi:hypothetical protein